MTVDDRRRRTFGWAFWIIAVLLPIAFIARAIVFILGFNSDALPEIFVWLAIAMALFALFATFRSVSSVFGTSLSAGPLGATLPERAALVDEKNALLRAIKDISFEHDVGKLSDAEFQRLDRSYRMRAREVLRKLDEDLAPYLEQAEKQLEDHLRRKLGPMRTAAHPGEKAAKKRGKKPKLDRAGKRARKLDGRLCASCGTANAPDAEVCVECAARIAPSVCPKCAAENAPDAKFCNKCAAEIPPIVLPVQS